MPETIVQKLNGSKFEKFFRAHLDLRKTPKTFLAVTYFIIAASIAPLWAALGDQTIVQNIFGQNGWTSIVPMNINGDGLTDLLFYNSTTGQAVYSIATGVPGEQRVVKDFYAAKGWTSVVP